MMWILAGIYCSLLWLVFAKLRLIRLSLPIAIIVGSVGPLAIVALLFCAQYYHPVAQNVLVVEKVVPITPQMTRPGRVTQINVKPNLPVKEGEVLFEVDRVPYENAVKRLTELIHEAESGVQFAESSVKVSEATIKRATTDLEFATSERNRQQELMDKQAGSQAALDQAVARYEQAIALLQQADIGGQQAILSVEVAKTKQNQAKVALAEAQYDLEQTSVLAPSDGYVTNLQLQVGMLVGGSAPRPVLSFISQRADSDSGVVTAMFGQKSYLLIKPNQYAEVVLDVYPGEVFAGKVLTTIDTSGKGQLQASGDLPTEIGAGDPRRICSADFAGRRKAVTAAGRRRRNSRRLHRQRSDCRDPSHVSDAIQELDSLPVLG